MKYQELFCWSWFTAGSGAYRLSHR